MYPYNMNVIGQQTEAYVSPLHTKVTTDQTNVYTKYQIQVLENTCMSTIWFARLSINDINYD